MADACLIKLHCDDPIAIYRCDRVGLFGRWGRLGDQKTIQIKVVGNSEKQAQKVVD